MDENKLEENGDLPTTDVHWLARLRDRVVNQGMDVIVEGARIEHPEDLVFSHGVRGFAEAIAALEAVASDAPGTTTIKWDGKPAIIFGRKPNGEFVLTDKRGFTASTIDQYTSPAGIASQMNLRKGDRTELNAMYAKIFPLLRAAVPDEYRGFIQADLMFSSKPELVDGRLEFTPNTVTYSVDPKSELGQKVAQSQVGIAIHTELDGPDATPRPITASALREVPGLIVLDPKLKDTHKLKLNKRGMDTAKSLLKDYSNDINAFLNPQTLRDLKILSLPGLIKKYVNFRVRSGNYKDMLAQFENWVQNESSTQAPRIIQHMMDNKKGVAAMFHLFFVITALKDDMVRQLDSHKHDVTARIADDPGHEGYVGANVKLVNRMKFSKANFANNNPDR